MRKPFTLLFRCVVSIRKFKELVFTDEQVESIIQTIEVERLPATKATQREHIDSLRDRYEPKNKTQPSAMVSTGELITTSKLAALLEISTDELLTQLEAAGFLKAHGNRYRITQAGKDAGGLWKPSKFGGYYLWPSTLTINLHHKVETVQLELFTLLTAKNQLCHPPAI